MTCLVTKSLHGRKGILKAQRRQRVDHEKYQMLNVPFAILISVYVCMPVLHVCACSINHVRRKKTKKNKIEIPTAYALPPFPSTSTSELRPPASRSSTFTFPYTSRACFISGSHTSLLLYCLPTPHSPYIPSSRLLPTPSGCGKSRSRSRSRSGRRREVQRPTPSPSPCPVSPPLPSNAHG